MLLSYAGNPKPASAGGSELQIPGCNEKSKSKTEAIRERRFVIGIQDLLGVW
jgi:hypothetical protein